MRPSLAVIARKCHCFLSLLGFLLQVSGIVSKLVQELLLVLDVAVIVMVNGRFLYLCDFTPPQRLMKGESSSML